MEPTRQIMDYNLIPLSSTWLSSPNADSTDSITVLLLLQNMTNMASTTQPDTGMACTIATSILLVPLKCIAEILHKLRQCPSSALYLIVKESITERHIIELCSRSFVDQQVQFLAHAKHFGQNKARTKKD